MDWVEMCPLGIQLRPVSSGQSHHKYFRYEDQKFIFIFDTPPSTNKKPTTLNKLNVFMQACLEEVFS